MGEEQFCYQCGETLNYIDEDDYWSSSFHIPFDSLLKIKSLLKNNYLCKVCMRDLIKKNTRLNKNTLHKDELLSLKKEISEIFEKRNSISNFPFKIIINPTTLPTKKPAQALFTVPKRNFKLAVDRNLLRRRIKDAYRKNKHDLYEYLEQNNLQLAIVIIYISNKELEYSEIEKKLVLSLQDIVNKLSDPNKKSSK